METMLKNAQAKLQAAKKKKGFSLVELMIVIAVIAILFVVLVSRAGFATNKAKEAGVKTDFRAFSTASEQMLRENSGMAGYEDMTAVTRDLNVYLDEALKFDVNGSSLKADPWNKAYALQFISADSTDTNIGSAIAEDESGAGNNGALIFLSGGQDGKLSTATDDTNNDYVQVSVWLDGYTHTATTGFSSNIEEQYFTAGNIKSSSTAPTFAVNDTSSQIEITYNGAATGYADGTSEGGVLRDATHDDAGEVKTNNGHGA